MICSLGILLSACGPISQSGEYRPEVTQPTQERINELARVDTPPVVLPRKMRIEVSPPLAIGGRPVEVRCFIPRHLDNRAMLLATAEQSMLRQLGNSSDEFLFTLRIPHAACGEQEVVCAVERADKSIVKRSARVMGVCGEP